MTAEICTNDASRLAEALGRDVLPSLGAEAEASQYGDRNAPDVKHKTSSEQALTPDP